MFSRGKRCSGVVFSSFIEFFPSNKAPVFSLRLVALRVPFYRRFFGWSKFRLNRWLVTRAAARPELKLHKQARTSWQRGEQKCGEDSVTWVCLRRLERNH